MIDSIPQYLIDEDGGYDRLKVEHDFFRVDNLDKQSRLSVRRKVIDRLKSIILVCELNVYDNEKWVGGLTKLMDTFDTMIEAETVLSKQIAKEIETVMADTEEFIFEFNESVRMKKDYIDYVDDTVQMRNSLGNQVKHTDMLIMNKLLLDQYKEEEQREMKEKVHEENVRYIQERNRKEKIEKETAMLRDEISKIKQVLDRDGIEVQDFLQSKKFHKMMYQKEKEKEIEIEIAMKKFRIQQLIEENRRLERIKETHRQAFLQKGSPDHAQQSDDTDDTIQLQTESSMNMNTIQTTIKIKKDILSRTKIVDVKSGILNVCQQTGVGDIDLFSIHKRSQEVFSMIQSKLKIVRTVLTKEQFDALLLGKLEVSKFLNCIEIERSIREPSY